MNIHTHSHTIEITTEIKTPSDYPLSLKDLITSKERTPILTEENGKNKPHYVYMDSGKSFSTPPPIFLKLEKEASLLRKSSLEAFFF